MPSLKTKRSGQFRAAQNSVIASIFSGGILLTDISLPSPARICAPPAHIQKSGRIPLSIPAGMVLRLRPVDIANFTPIDWMA